MTRRAPTSSATSVLYVWTEKFDHQGADAFLEKKPKLVVFVEKRRKADKQRLQKLEAKGPSHLDNAEEPEGLVSVNQLHEVLDNKK